MTNLPANAIPVPLETLSGAPGSDHPRSKVSAHASTTKSVVDHGSSNLSDNTAEVDANARDAARYRFLRGPNEVEGGPFYGMDALDQSVDAAMAAAGVPVTHSTNLEAEPPTLEVEPPSGAAGVRACGEAEQVLRDLTTLASEATDHTPDSFRRSVQALAQRARGVAPSEGGQPVAWYRVCNGQRMGVSFDRLPEPLIEGWTQHPLVDPGGAAVPAPPSVWDAACALAAHYDELPHAAQQIAVKRLFQMIRDTQTDGVGVDRGDTFSRHTPMGAIRSEAEGGKE